VWNLTLALRNRKGKDGKPFRTEKPIDDYTADVVNDVRAFQRAQGWTGAGADGIAGPQTIKRLGLVWVDDK
jgi:murein L,D-transpeptidase YcbB/YkuD